MIGSGGPPEESVVLEATVERKRPSLPRFVTIPSEALDGWRLTATTVVLVEINTTSIGRRSLKYWKERDSWFFNLTAVQCREAGLDQGDVVQVRLALADQSPPPEIRDLLEEDPSVRRKWDSLSQSRRRSLSEHVRGGKREDTRRRRARAVLDDWCS